MVEIMKKYKPETCLDCTPLSCNDCVYLNMEHCLNCRVREQHYKFWEIE